MIYHWSLSDRKSSPIIIIIIPWELFKPALADGLSLESEWQQVSSGLQDFSPYLGKY